MMVVMQVLDGNCGHCKGDLVLYCRRKRWRYETRRDEAESQTSSCHFHFWRARFRHVKATSKPALQLSNLKHNDSKLH
jgi:hypothetical protein